MSHRAFRICKTRHLATAFDGEGARKYGGRWNSKGTRMVYLASSLSGATLELLVHTDDYSMIADLYSYVPVEIPEECVQVLDVSTLPANWNAAMPTAATQLVGDRWIASGSSAILQVPSAITMGEFNFLGNPDHGDFLKLVAGRAKEFRLDERL